jgi:A/G-specific adenine glycosylase
MLQQTTVRAVVPYFERFLRAFPTVEDLAAARLNDVLACWSGLGYYRRARSLHESARIIVERHEGRFPTRVEEALALPGIGRYTAGAILSIAHGRRLPVVDGNASRVLSRLLLLRGAHSAARDRRLWSAATGMVAAAADPGDLNQALMELGATVCTPLDPACPRCPLRALCRSRSAGLQNRVPPPRRVSRSPVNLRADVAVVKRAGRLLLRRRPDRGLMRGLWEFPTLSRGGGSDGLRLRMRKPVATVRHSITYRRFELRVRPARLLSEPPRGRYRWVRPADLRRLPTSSMVPKILAALQACPDLPARAKV